MARGQTQPPASTPPTAQPESPAPARLCFPAGPSFHAGARVLRSQPGPQRSPASPPAARSSALPTSSCSSQNFSQTLRPTPRPPGAQRGARPFARAPPGGPSRRWRPGGRQAAPGRGRERRVAAPRGAGPSERPSAHGEERVTLTELPATGAEVHGGGRSLVASEAALQDGVLLGGRVVSGRGARSAPPRVPAGNRPRRPAAGAPGRPRGLRAARLGLRPAPGADTGRPGPAARGKRQAGPASQSLPGRRPCGSGASGKGQGQGTAGARNRLPGAPAPAGHYNNGGPVKPRAPGVARRVPRGRPRRREAASAGGREAPSQA